MGGVRDGGVYGRCERWWGVGGVREMVGCRGCEGGVGGES